MAEISFFTQICDLQHDRPIIDWIERYWSYGDKKAFAVGKGACGTCLVVPENVESSSPTSRPLTLRIADCSLVIPAVMLLAKAALRCYHTYHVLSGDEEQALLEKKDPIYLLAKRISAGYQRTLSGSKLAQVWQERLTHPNQLPQMPSQGFILEDAWKSFSSEQKQQFLVEAARGSESLEKIFDLGFSHSWLSDMEKSFLRDLAVNFSESSLLKILIERGWSVKECLLALIGKGDAKKIDALPLEGVTLTDEELKQCWVGALGHSEALSLVEALRNKLKLPEDSDLQGQCWLAAISHPQLSLCLKMKEIGFDPALLPSELQLKCWKRGLKNSERFQDMQQAGFTPGNLYQEHHYSLWLTVVQYSLSHVWQALGEVGFNGDVLTEQQKIFLKNMAMQKAVVSNYYLPILQSLNIWSQH